MQEEKRQGGKRQFVIKKAYEIGYAVFRIGSRIANAALKEHLERQALSLLDAATVGNYGWVSTVSKAIEYLVRFGSDVGLIHEANKETILSQLQSLIEGVAGPEKAATAEEVPLNDIFSGHEPLFSASHSAHRPANMTSAASVTNAANQPNPAKQQSSDGNDNGEESGIGPEIRQSAILEKIRQSGNCRLRDIQEMLPDCSERTIRYDLQTLAERGSIERIGTGGPSVFYRIRQSAQMPQ